MPNPSPTPLSPNRPYSALLGPARPCSAPLGRTGHAAPPHLAQPCSQGVLEQFLIESQCMPNPSPTPLSPNRPYSAPLGPNRPTPHSPNRPYSALLGPTRPEPAPHARVHCSSGQVEFKWPSHVAEPLFPTPP